MILNAIESGDGRPVVLLHGLFGLARNLGSLQRALSPRFRVIAMDLRNHGGSPHAAGMTYDIMAADVLETMEALSALGAAVIGHSMGGKTAMRLALRHPDAVSRLLVADIAPVAYPPRNQPIAAALAAIPLVPGMTRTDADAALAPVVDNPGLRGFLLQNLVGGATPHWRIGLAEITAALRDLEGWDSPGVRTYTGPTLFVAGDKSDFIRPEHRPLIRALFPAARFVTVKNASHWLHADNPTALIDVVHGFLARWATA